MSLYLKVTINCTSMVHDHIDVYILLIVREVILITMSKSYLKPSCRLTNIGKNNSNSV